MRRFYAALIALTCGTAFAADTDPKLEGTWVVVSVERDGKADAAMTGAVREQKGDKYTLTPKSGKSIGGTIAVDAAKNTFEMKPDGGKYQGKTLPGIYKIEGGKLVMAFAEPGKDRPTEYKGDGVVVATYEKK